MGYVASIARQTGARLPLYAQARAAYHGGGWRGAGPRRPRIGGGAMDASGLDHIILTVADPARSRAFYGDTLGFAVEVIPEDPDGAFYFAVGGVSFFVFPSRRPLAGDRFSEFRIGLDHLAFRAPSEAALHALAERLTADGVETQGVERFAPTGNLYVAFRDPDNIQLEYWLPEAGGRD
jgi:catechol 2,3-dioxygenase-like lactoylglutathione lyase family enzyme